MIGILGIIAHSIRVDKPELNKYAAVLVLLRSYLPCFDIEERRHYSSDVYNAYLLIAAINGIGIQQVLNNLILEKKYSIP